MSFPGKKDFLLQSSPVRAKVVSKRHLARDSRPLSHRKGGDPMTVMFGKKKKKKRRSPIAENSARIRREAGILFALGAMIPAVAGLVTELSSRRKK